MILVHFQGKPFDIIVIEVYAQPLTPKKLKLNGSVKTSWEICMQVRKQQLELDMEQQTGSK